MQRDIIHYLYIELFGPVFKKLQKNNCHIPYADYLTFPIFASSLHPYSAITITTMS